MYTVRVDPERLRYNRVYAKLANFHVGDAGYTALLKELTSETDVATSTVGKAKFGKDPKGACHLLQLPLSLSNLGIWPWDLEWCLGTALCFRNDCHSASGCSRGFRHDWNRALVAGFLGGLPFGSVS